MMESPLVMESTNDLLTFHGPVTSLRCLGALEPRVEQDPLPLSLRRVGVRLGVAAAQCDWQAAQPTVTCASESASQWTEPRSG